MDRERARSALPAALRGWHLSIYCEPCRRIRMLPVGDLPPALTIGAGVARLRCGACGAPPAGITLESGFQGTGRDVEKIVLLPSRSGA